MRLFICIFLILAGSIFLYGNNVISLKEDEQKKNQIVDRTPIVVFVALCDNEHQGIAPVPAKIGKGDDPDNNLYWGCSDGLPKVFKKGGNWKQLSSQSFSDGPVMRKIRYKQVKKEGMELVAMAYRGDRMRECLTDFETAIANGNHKLVAFIGHNGLMDMDLGDPPQAKGEGKTAAMVLCCKSNEYFTPRLKAMKCRPVLMTKQNMYPGSFLLHDSLNDYIAGKSEGAIKHSAARAYAKNQKISVKAAAGIFADL